MSSEAFAIIPSLDFIPKKKYMYVIIYCLPSPLSCKMPEGMYISVFVHCHSPGPGTE